MSRKKNKNYGSYDELHEGIMRNKRDGDEWIPNHLDPNKEILRLFAPNIDKEAAEDEQLFPMTKADYLKAGILQIVDDKTVPGPHANKRFVKTRYGVEFYPEYVERKIKQRLYNNLASKNVTHLVPFRDFMRMSIDEIDTMYDPTKRYYQFSDTRYRAQEKEWERRRRLWEKEARKNKKWWTDFAKKQINDAYANSVVEYDKNMLTLTLLSRSKKPIGPLPENKVEQARLVQNHPVDYDNKQVEAKESFKSKKKAQKKSKKRGRKKLTDYDSGTTFFGWLKNKKLVIGPKKFRFEDRTEKRNYKSRRY